MMIFALDADYVLYTVLLEDPDLTQKLESL